VLDTARGGIYIFAVWAGLIGVAFLLSRRIGRAEAGHKSRRPSEGGEGG
jgi:hypothetical protein